MTEGLQRSCPPALTGGESPEKSIFGVVVDWLTFTFLPAPDELVPRQFFDWLNSNLIKKVQAIDVPGMLGYEFGVKFFVMLDDGKEHHIGRLDWGGSFHKQRARFDLSGSGCALVKDWAAMQDFVGTFFDWSLTRVDLAADFIDGEYTVEDAKSWYESGLFNAGGRMPRHSLVGDWLAPKYGRTLEVGRRENGKMLRCYEKGRQLGDPDSKWTRFEVEIRNIDRVIPLNILTQCNDFFAGSYKCLAPLVEAAAARIQTVQKEGEISLEKLTDHARSSYGRLVTVLGLFMAPEQIFKELSLPGVPARLEKASLHGISSKRDSRPSLQPSGDF